jgi:hypothetical protein
MNTCIGCGCTDQSACEGGCSWVRLDEQLQLGVCSQCDDIVQEWDAREDAGELEEFFLTGKPSPAPSIVVPGDAEYSDTLRYLRSR